MWGGPGEWVWPGLRYAISQLRLTYREGSGLEEHLSSAALEAKAVFTQVSLHNAQVFRLLLKTSVEREHQ